MADNTDKIEVRNNEAERRFEAQVGPYTAICAYQRRGDVITFTHTRVPDEMEGKGVGSTLVKNALEEARREHLTVVPLCPFVADYIRRHHEYLDLVAPDYRERLEQE